MCMHSSFPPTGRVRSKLQQCQPLQRFTHCCASYVEMNASIQMHVHIEGNQCNDKASQWCEPAFFKNIVKTLTSPHFSVFTQTFFLPTTFQLYISSNDIYEPLLHCQLQPPYYANVDFAVAVSKQLIHPVKSDSWMTSHCQINTCSGCLHLPKMKFKMNIYTIMHVFVCFMA